MRLQSYVRQLAITIVLATDLALSFDIVGKFKITFGNKDLKIEGAKEIKETKDMLLKMVRGGGRGGLGCERSLGA